MSEAADRPTTSNQVHFVEGDGANVNIHDSQIFVNAGGAVHADHPSATATTKAVSENMKQETRLNGIAKTVKKRTVLKSRVKITRNYQTLSEPLEYFSPQMREIEDYFEGGYWKENGDEFELVKRIVTTGKPIKYDKFLKSITHGESKRIALIGGAGYGKTTEIKKLAQKLLTRESQNDHDQMQFNIVHLIDVKDVRQKDSTTLQNFLFGKDIPDAGDRKLLLDWVEGNQESFTILLDGLDQANFDTAATHDKVSYWEEASTETLVYNLMTKNIFPNVTVLVSSREHAISTLAKDARPERIIALAGFEQSDAKNLFLDLIQDDGQSLESIEQNLGDLIATIVIPVYLVYTAVVYKHNKKKGKKLPDFISGLLANIIDMLPKDDQMQKSTIDVMKKLMKLAYKGMKHKLMSFDEAYLRKYCLTPEEVSDLMPKVPTENILPHQLLEKDYFYFFCHQSMEEFLAACYISERGVRHFKSIVKRIRRKKKFSHWSVVIQFLSGIILNSTIELDQRLHEVSDKNKKKEILRDALRRPPTNEDGLPPPAYYLALHESNDDELIRQLQRIYIRLTPLTSNLARGISSLMRRSESMERIRLHNCGMTDELLRLITENMKDSHLRVDRLYLLEDEWNVTCSTLKSFLDNLEVDQLTMQAFPTDYHEDFSNFKNVKTLKMWVILPYDVIITNEGDRVLFESENYEMSGNFNKKEKLLKLHFSGEHGLFDDRVVTNLKKLCSTEKVEVTRG